MKVIKAYPPNFATLAKAFPIKGRPGILYAFGDKLYNPSGVKVTPWIMAHEMVHGERQQDEGMYLEKWWDEYINYPDFRLKEELLAHRAEWKEYQKYVTAGGTYLDAISTRLSSPLYGSLLSFEEAKRRIANGG